MKEGIGRLWLLAACALALLLALPLPGLAQDEPPVESDGAAENEAPPSDDEPIYLGEIELEYEQPEAPAEPVEESLPPVEDPDAESNAVVVALLEQPAIERVITAEQIAQSGAGSLNELLRREAGFTVSEFFGGTEVSYQGLPSKFTSVLIDGQRLPGHILERSDLSQLPLGSIERIEVISGPQSAAYGPDNAAVILNIVTKSGGENELALGAGSLGYNSQRLSLAGGDADEGSWYTSLQRRVRASYDFNGSNIDTDGDSFRQYDIFAKYRRDFGCDKLALQAGWFTEDATGLSFAPPSLERHSDTLTRRLHFAASYEWSLGRESSLRLEQGAASYYHRLDRYFIGFEDDTQSTGFTEQLADTRLHYKGSLGEVGLGLGAEYNRERIDSDRVEGQEREAEIAAGYIVADWEASDRLSLSAALRYDEHSQFGGQLSPRASASYRLDEKSLLTAAVGQGYRSPSLRELYFDFDSPFGYSVIGNESLQPETRLSYSLDYSFNSEIWRLNLSGFRHEIDELIDFVEVQSAPQVFETQNIADVHTMGLSLSGERRFMIRDAGRGECAKGAQFWGIGYDATWLPEAVDGELDTRLINSPELDQVLRVFYERRALRAEALLRHSGGRFTDRANEVEAPAYSTLDLTLRRSAGSGEWRLSALNVLDERDARFGPEPGRELRVEYALEF